MKAKTFFVNFFLAFFVAVFAFGFGGISRVFATGSGQNQCSQNGWYVTYYNYPSTNIGMNLPTSEWYKDYGDPLSLGGTWTANWYDDTFKRFTAVESDLLFGSSFFPFDANPEEITNGHDHYFGLKAEAKVIAPSSGSYAYTFSSDDDLWVYVNGALVIDDSGVHPASTKTGNITLNAGENLVQIFFAERHIVESELNFKFDNTSLTVKPNPCVNQNTAPIAQNSSINTNEDTAVSGNLNATDSDVPANTLTYAITLNPANGSLTAFNASTGAFTYTPNANYNGTDSFKWKANDGTADSNEATVTITINPVNDAPVIVLNGTTPVEVPKGGTFTDPGAVCTDVEDGALSVTTGNGGFDANTLGSYTFTYSCTDSNGAIATVTRVVVVVEPGTETPNEAPEISLNGPSEVTIVKGETFNDPGAVCTDKEDGILSVTKNSGGFDKDNLGAYTMTYSCKDSKNATDSVTRKINVINQPTNNGGGGGGVPAAVLLPSALNIAGTPISPAQGEVLGVETSCGIYVDKFLRKGYKGNNREAVIKLQQFLNDYENAKLSLDGIFGTMTERALMAFQKKYENDVLLPWGIKAPTGIFYLTTQTKVNNIMCPPLNLPIPADLKPFSTHPETPKA